MDNTAGALAPIMFSNGRPEMIHENRREMMRAVLSCTPVKNDPMENTTIARAIMKLAKTDYEWLVQPGLSGKVLPCLVTTVLAYRDR